MKNLFLYLPPLFPSLDHNAHLVLKLVPHIDCNSYAIAYGSANNSKTFPHMIMNTPACFIRKHNRIDKILRNILCFLLGPVHGANCLAYIQFTLQSLPLKIKHKPHAVLSTYQWPYLPIITALARKNCKSTIFNGSHMRNVDAGYDIRQRIQIFSVCVKTTRCDFCY